MKEVQIQRFKEAAEEILGDDCNPITVYDEDRNMVISAKIVVNRSLKGWEAAALQNMANSWYFKDIEITRSGAGLRINFNDFQAKPVLS